jgi:hypothetical protein
MEIVPVDSVIDDIEKYVDMSNDESDSSAEELGLTTLHYETKTEANPPMITQTTSTLEELSMSSILTKKFGDGVTEYGIVSESSEIIQDHPEVNVKKAMSKSIKARLLDTILDEVLVKPEHQDDETIESLSEDTTTIADIDSEINETNIDVGEEATTIQAPTSKKPKKIEIYKTRPNELLRHYVEDSHLRSPIAALIDKKSNPLVKAKKLWKAALKPNSLLDIMVVSYDSEGKIIFKRLLLFLIFIGSFFQELKALTI